MTLEPRFEPYEDAHAAALAAWIASDEWPYHGTARPGLAQVQGWIDRGDFTGSENRTFWIGVEGEPRAALLAIHELDDPTPIFDLRVRTPYRRRGLGRSALAWLARHIFTETEKHRVEGHTRADNEPMRRLFRSAGWVMEAFYRQAWPDPAGTYHDAVGYALLKDDWLRGTTTPILRDPPRP